MPDVADDARRLQALLTTLGRQHPIHDPMAMLAENLTLTGPQMHAIVWVGQEQAIRMSELARRCGISEKTCTGLVDRLEAKQLVERVRSETDRRVITVRLTARGTKVYRDLDREIFRRFCSFLSLLSTDDRHCLFRIFDNLLATLSERQARSREPS